MSKNTRTGTPARARIAALLILAASAVACGGGSGSDAVIAAPADPAASFTGSGTAFAQNLVRTAGSAAGDLVTVEVIIGGPTTSTDLYSFAFDLKLGDATVAEYVAGSASVGPALTATGGQTVHVLAAQVGDRVTVGVTKLGDSAGNGVTEPGEKVIVDFVFRLLRQGTTTLTLQGSPGSDPAALDSAGAVIDSVIFDTAPAILSGF